MDRWVLSRLNTLVKTVDGHLDKLRITEGGRALQAFSDELSNWYVRRCRERYWGSEMTEDKKAAYMTLYTALNTLTLLSAPFLPFMTEEIYQNIVRSVDKNALESVHFCDYPAVDESRIDADLEANMARVLDIVTLGRAARNDGAVKTRQPLALMYIQGEPMNEHYVKIVTEELNVKKAEFVVDASGFLSYQVKPQLKTLGPRYGKILPKIGAHLSETGRRQRGCPRTRVGKELRSQPSRRSSWCWGRKTCSSPPARRTGSSPRRTTKPSWCWTPSSRRSSSTKGLSANSSARCRPCARKRALR